MLKKIKEKYKEKYPDLKLQVNEIQSGKYIEIGLIVVPDYLRNEGIGQDIVIDIIEYSNATNKLICITPATSKEDAETFGIDKEGLKRFWKGFGFFNRVGNSEYEDISHSMVRKVNNPYSEDKKTLYEVLTQNIDISLIQNFSFDDFYKDIIEEIKKFPTMEEFLKNVDMSKKICKYIEADLLKTGNVEDSETITAAERIGVLKTLKKLGEGSDRIVYELGDNLVIKVSKNTRGNIQNNSEFQFANEQDYMLDKKLLPNMSEAGEDYIITEKAVPYSALEKEGKKRISDFLKKLKKFNQQDWDNKTTELQEVFEEVGYYDLINYDLLMNDFSAGRNWGIDSEDNIIMLDGGTIGDPSFLNEPQTRITRREAGLKKKYDQVLTTIYEANKTQQTASKDIYVDLINKITKTEKFNSNVYSSIEDKYLNGECNTLVGYLYQLNNTGKCYEINMIGPTEDFNDRIYHAVFEKDGFYYDIRGKYESIEELYKSTPYYEEDMEIEIIDWEISMENYYTKIPKKYLIDNKSKNLS